MEATRRLLIAACNDWSSRSGEIGGSRVLLASLIAKGPTRVLRLVPTAPVEVLATLLPIPRNLDSIETIDLGCSELVPSPPLSWASVSGRWSGGCRGSSRNKVDPWPSPSDSAHSRPPCWVTIPAHVSMQPSHQGKMNLVGQVFTHALVSHPLNHSVIHSIIQSLNHAVIHSSIVVLIHSIRHCSTHLTHLTHSASPTNTLNKLLSLIHSPLEIHRPSPEPPPF